MVGIIIIIPNIDWLIDFINFIYLFSKTAC